MKVLKVLFLFVISNSIFSSCFNDQNYYNKTHQTKKSEKIAINKDSNHINTRFVCPRGFTRIKDSNYSYGLYLSSFKLYPDRRNVKTYDGNDKSNKVHAAVLDIDIGNRDLQQCADAVMRLRAEYLYSNKEYDKITFRFLGDGKMHSFLDYSGGKRDYKTFRKYMDYVFSYANTASLRLQMKPRNISEVEIGDVFIQSGKPYGHAVIIMDLCQDSVGNKKALLAQSYMPAQDIHILKNFEDPKTSPWFDMKEGQIITPEWKFKHTDLKHF